MRRQPRGYLLRSATGAMQGSCISRRLETVWTPGAAQPQPKEELVAASHWRLGPTSAWCPWATWRHLWGGGRPREMAAAPGRGSLHRWLRLDRTRARRLAQPPRMLQHRRLADVGLGTLLHLITRRSEQVKRRKSSTTVAAWRSCEEYRTAPTTCRERPSESAATAVACQ